jgi:lipoprotein NlpI
MRSLLLLLVAGCVAGPFAQTAIAQPSPDQRQCAAMVGGRSPEPELRAKIEACTRIIDQSTGESVANRVTALSNRGWAYRMARQQDRAIADYTAAIALDPNNSRLFVDRGIALSERGLDGRALEDFEHAISLGSNSSVPFRERATMLAKKGDFERALRDYTEVVRRDHNEIYIRQRGFLNLIVGRYEDAAADFSRALLQKADDPYLVLWLYFSRERAGKVDAREELRINAIALRPGQWPYPIINQFVMVPRPAIPIDKDFPKAPAATGNPGNACEVHFYTGQRLLLQGDRAGATYALTQATAICPKNRYHAIGRSDIWLADVAQADLNRLDAVLVNPAELIKRRLQDEIARTAEFQEGIQKYTRAIEDAAGRSSDARAQLLNDRAAAYQSMGDFENAVADYTAAIKIEPTHSQYWMNRCGAHALSRRFELAVADCDEAVKLEPTSAEAFKRRGVMHFVNARHESAVADFLNARQLDPKDARAVIWHYLAQEHVGGLDVDAQLRKVRDTLAKDHWPYPLVELFLSHSVDPLLNNNPQAESCEVQFYVGQYYLLRGQRDRAMIALQKAAALSCARSLHEYLGSVAEIARLDAVLQERLSKKQRRDAEAARLRREESERIAKFEQLIESHRAALAQSGDPVFEFSYTNGAWGYQNLGCLIGQSGSIYTYDIRRGPGIEHTGRTVDAEYQRAREIAKSLTDQRFEAKHRAFDAGTSSWTATVAGNRQALKITGEHEGARGDEPARELVNLIARWCPAAAEAIAFEEKLNNLGRLRCSQPDPRVPVRLCAPSP